MSGCPLSQWARRPAARRSRPPARSTHFPHFGVAHGDDFDAERLAGLLPLRHVGLHGPRSLGATRYGLSSCGKPACPSGLLAQWRSRLSRHRPDPAACHPRGWQRALAVRRQERGEGGRKESRDASAGGDVTAARDAALVTRLGFAAHPHWGFAGWRRGAAAALTPRGPHSLVSRATLQEAFAAFAPTVGSPGRILRLGVYVSLRPSPPEIPGRARFDLKWAFFFFF